MCATVTNLSRIKRVVHNKGVSASKRRAHRAMRRWVRQQDLTGDFGTPPKAKRFTDFDYA